MSPVHDYNVKEINPEEWRDVLARRVMAQTKRLHCLALSGDGRLGLGLATTVSVLNPSIVIRFAKIPLPLVSVEMKPFDAEMLSSDARVTRDIRPPHVGHEVIFESGAAKVIEARKDTMLGRADIACVSWAPSSAGSVLFIVNGEGCCFAAVPRYADQEMKEGTWGGLFGLWRHVKLFQLAGGGPERASNETRRGSARATRGMVERKSANGLGGAHGSLDARNNVAGGHRKLSTVSNGVRQHGHVHCITFCKVFDSITNASNFGEEQHYIVVGTNTGAFMYSIAEWQSLNTMCEPDLILCDGRSGPIASLADVDIRGRSTTLIAIGGSFGALTIHGIWVERRDSDGLALNHETLWKAETTLLFGPLNCVSWSIDTPSKGQLKLAVGAGNSIVILDWTEALQSLDTGSFQPKIQRISQAHAQLVSSVEICVDNSIVSASLDGTIYRWVEKERTNSGNGPSEMSCARLQDAGNRLEPVMAMSTTCCKFGIVTMTTTSRLCTEVNGIDDDPKYSAGARRSLLSSFIMPATHSTERITEFIFAKLDSLITSRRCVGEAIATWDIELFVAQLDADESGLLDALRHRLQQMLEQLKHRQIPIVSKPMFEHYAITLLNFAQLIINIGGTDLPSIEQTERTQGEVIKSVRCAHYDKCLERFLNGNFNALTASIDECRALESMCQFISVCCQDLMWDWEQSLERVRQIRDLLEPRISQGESLAIACEICKPECYLPLVSDAADATSFYCSNGDCFTRCVLTALPVTDVVPLACYVCNARALMRDFDPFREGERAEFGWIANIGRCPQCMSALLPSSVEMQS